MRYSGRSGIIPALSVNPQPQLPAIRTAGTLCVETRIYVSVLHFFHSGSRLSETASQRKRTEASIPVNEGQPALSGLLFLDRFVHSSPTVVNQVGSPSKGPRQSHNFVSFCNIVFHKPKFFVLPSATCKRLRGVQDPEALAIPQAVDSKTTA